MSTLTKPVRPVPLSIHCECPRSQCQGEVIEFVSPSAREVFVRCDPYSICLADSDPRQQAERFYACLPHVLARAGVSLHDVVAERVFFRDKLRHLPAVDETRQAVYRNQGVPLRNQPIVSSVEQPPCDEHRALELQVYAVASQPGHELEIETVCGEDGAPLAKIVTNDGCRHLHAVGIQGTGTSLRAQFDSMFANARELLESQGSTFSDVVRTWYYLDDIDRDYTTFNLSRNAFFQEQQLLRLPASTGIGARFRGLRACCGMDLYALLTPDHAQLEVMQCPSLNEAPEYGSAFSRGMKVTLPHQSILYLSGTASVDEQGATAHVGDARRQMDRMLSNVRQLLAAQGAGFHHLVQVISYLRYPGDTVAYREVLARWGLSQLPNSIVHAHVCRPDLLCELEAIAVVPRVDSGSPSDWTSR